MFCGVNGGVDALRADTEDLIRYREGPRSYLNRVVGSACVVWFLRYKTFAVGGKWVGGMEFI